MQRAPAIRLAFPFHLKFKMPGLQAALYAACLAPLAAGAAEFTPLGDLTGGGFASYATGVSDDGSVVVGRSIGASGYEAFKTLGDIVPRPDHKATGEERAWGRRLAKRFGIDTSAYDDKTFVATGDGTFPLALDHESLEPEKIDPAVAAFFDPVDPARGDSLVAFGWAMASQSTCGLSWQSSWRRARAICWVSLSWSESTRLPT